jgi:hypothetical protein
VLRATMAHLSQEGEVLWRRIVTRGGPGLPFALKTAKAGRRIEIACELLFHPESIAPSCPPFLPQTQGRQRTAGQHVQSRGTSGAQVLLDCFASLAITVQTARSALTVFAPIARSPIAGAGARPRSGHRTGGPHFGRACRDQAIKARAE